VLQWTAEAEKTVPVDYFAILNLRPGRYSSAVIDRQCRSVRRDILRRPGPQRQRRLDDVLIAHALLRDPARQAALRRRREAEMLSLPRRPIAAPRRPAPPVASAEPIRPAPKAAPGRISNDSTEDVYTRFTRLVADHVEQGLLRFTARQRLMLIAEGMGIGAFKANLVIAEVLHDLRDGRYPPGRLVTGPAIRPGGARPHRRRYALRIALAVLAAAGIDWLLLTWLLR